MKCDKCIHKELCKTAEFEHFYGADECEFYDEIKHGQWILIRKDYLTADGWIHNLYKCDMCGRQIDGGRENFCPSCGTDMRKRKETNE